MNTIGWAIHAARAIAAVVVFVAVSSAALAAEPLHADFSNRLSLGYDSFVDRFTILDDDTADAVHDLYAGLGNSLVLSKGSARLALGNVLSYGYQTFDEAIDCDAGVNPAPSWRLDARSGLRYKHYHERSDFASANNYLQGNASVRVRKRFSDSFRAGVQGRLELVEFERRTLFDYNYLYGDAGLEIEAGSDYANMLRVSASAGSRDAPDTTALGFDRIVADLEAHEEAGDLSVHMNLFADRRDYRGDVRSDRWNINSNFEAAFGSAGDGSFSVRAETELLSYDRPDTAYFNSQFLRGGFRTRFAAGDGATIFIEPRYGQMLCRDFAEERYRELSVIIGIDVFGQDRFWLTASYEPGYRDYTEPTNELYSDFILNRASIMGTLTITKGFSVNLFLNHEPEIHSRREDDFSITLVSLDLTYRF